MGQTAMKLKDMQRYIEDVRGLLAGETINWASEGKTHLIRFLNPDLGLIDIENGIPLFVSAFGEKSRQLTAELNAGWLNFAGVQQQALSSLEAMQQQWLAGGRSKTDLHSTLFTLGCVLRPGESAKTDRVMAQAGPLVAVAYHGLMEGFSPEIIEQMFPPERVEQLEAYRKIYESYTPDDAKYLELHRGHLMFIRPEEVPFITEDIILNSTFTATREVLVERIRELEHAGYSQFTIQLVEGQESAIDDWAEVMALI